MYGMHFDHITHFSVYRYLLSHFLINQLNIEFNQLFREKNASSPQYKQTNVEINFDFSEVMDLIK